VFEAQKGKNTEELIEAMKNREWLRAVIKEVDQRAPEFSKAILHDRDLYMYQQLLRTPGDIVVAVVGLAHVEGIERRWNDAVLYKQERPK